MRAKQWTLAAYPTTETAVADFALEECELSPLADGEAPVKVGWIGLAPSLRFRMTAGGSGLPGMKIGDPITAASGVGLVLDSKRPGVFTGDIVYGDVGWADYTNIGADRYLVPVGRIGQPLSNPRGVLGEASAYSAGSYRPEDSIGLLGGAAMAAWIGLELVDARLCGVIAEYETGQATALSLPPLVFRDIAIHGYFADDYISRWGAALDTLGPWLTEGRLRRAYDVEHGIERLPSVYLRLFRGHTNRGKLMLHVADL